MMVSVNGDVSSHLDENHDIDFADDTFTCHTCNVINVHKEG